MSESGSRATRCIVFCDHRDDAQRVKEELTKLQSKDGAAKLEIELFVGGHRLYERDEAERWLAERGFLAGSDQRPEHAIFVVATSAGEGGVDLDADHMLCDMVAWERMFQRVGRVNRRGGGCASVVVVPVIAEDHEVRLRLEAIRALLHELPRGDNGTIHASPGAVAAPRTRSADTAAIAWRQLHLPADDNYTSPLVNGWPDRERRNHQVTLEAGRLSIPGSGRVRHRRRRNFLASRASIVQAGIMEVERCGA